MVSTSCLRPCVLPCSSSLQDRPKNVSSTVRVTASANQQHTSMAVAPFWQQSRDRLHQLGTNNLGHSQPLHTTQSCRRRSVNHWPCQRGWQAARDTGSAGPLALHAAAAAAASARCRPIGSQARSLPASATLPPLSSGASNLLDLFPSPSQPPLPATAFISLPATACCLVAGSPASQWVRLSARARGSGGARPSVRSRHVVNAMGSGSGSGSGSGRSEERRESSSDDLSKQAKGEEEVDRAVNQREEEDSESHSGPSGGAAATSMGAELLKTTCEGDTDCGSDENEAQASAAAESERKAEVESEAMSTPASMSVSMSVEGDWREFRAKLVQQGLQVADPTSSSTSSSSSAAAAVDHLPSGSPPAGAEPAAGGRTAGSEEEGELEGIAAGVSDEWENGSESFITASDRPQPSLDTVIGSGTLTPTPTPIPSAAGARSWAHPLFLPETGCLLLAHPQAFLHSQHYFHRAVIFLLTHGDEGTVGVILNRPSQYTLGQVAGFEELLPAFSSCPLYVGGDVGRSSIHCVHGCADLQPAGAQPVCSGIYVGGYAELKQHVEEGRSNPMDYRWFARYSGWAPGQLEREVAAGVWFLSACSPDLVLRHCADTTASTSLWSQVMMLMGGEYTEIARLADEDRPLGK